MFNLLIILHNLQYVYIVYVHSFFFMYVCNQAFVQFTDCFSAWLPSYDKLFSERIGNRLELHSMERNKIAITHAIPMAYDGMFLPISIVLRGFSGSIS